MSKWTRFYYLFRIILMNNSSIIIVCLLLKICWKKTLFSLYLLILLNTYIMLHIKTKLIYQATSFSSSNIQLVIPVLLEFWKLVIFSSDFFIYDDGLTVHDESSLSREYAISFSGLRSSLDTAEIPAALITVYWRSIRHCIFTFTVMRADVSDHRALISIKWAPGRIWR